MEKKKLDKGEKTSMTPQRKDRLEAIDFKWAKAKGQASWDMRFKELKAFKKEVHIPSYSSICKTASILLTFFSLNLNTSTATATCRPNPKMRNSRVTVSYKILLPRPHRIMQ